MARDDALDVSWLDELEIMATELLWDDTREDRLLMDTTLLDTRLETEADDGAGAVSSAERPLPPQADRVVIVNIATTKEHGFFCFMGPSLHYFFAERITSGSDSSNPAAGPVPGAGFGVHPGWFDRGC